MDQVFPAPPPPLSLLVVLTIGCINIENANDKGRRRVIYSSVRGIELALKGKCSYIESVYKNLIVFVSLTGVDATMPHPLTTISR